MSAAADANADSQQLSAAKRMKTMGQREVQSPYWTPTPPVTSVSYTGQSAAAAAIEEAHSLSSTPSSTVS